MKLDWRFIAPSLSSLALVALTGCGGVDVTESSAEVTSEVVATPFVRGTAYTIEKDYRRCVSPLCGGYWVEAANRRATRCADGSNAQRCYVAEVDWSALGLSQSQQSTLIDKAASGQAIIVGRVVSRVFRGFGNLGALTPERAWQAANAQAPTGQLLKVRDLGIRCVTTPCFSMQADLLNQFTRNRISGLNLSPVGASRDQLAAASDALADGDLLVAGAIRNDPVTSRRHRPGRTLTASQFYLPVEPVQCTVNSDCTISSYDEPVATRADCYCVLCPGPVGVTQVDANRDNWQRLCPAVTQTCPVVRCIRPPPVGCRSDQCVFLPPRTAVPQSREPGDS